MPILMLVVYLIIGGVILWAVSAMPWIDAGVKRVLYILLVVVGVIWFLQATGLMHGHWNVH
jgi:hypothetical protein